MIKGIGVSSGISMGKTFVYMQPTASVNDHTSHFIGTTEEEKIKLDAAIEKAKTELDSIIVIPNQLTEIKEILQAHQMMIEDPELYQGALTYIGSGKSAYDAYETVANQFCEMLSCVEDDYLRQRVQDIKDATGRVLGILKGEKGFTLAHLQEPVILVADDIAPSMAAQFSSDLILGIITQQGGETSHTAILANALGIPAILGVHEATHHLKDTYLVMDGESGIIEVNPNSERMAEFKDKQTLDKLEKERLAKFKDQPTSTKDGEIVQLFGNIGSGKDAKGVCDQGGEGVGLFRTEFLFMDTDTAPSEERQFESYKEAVLSMGHKPVIIRTLDVGGDKHIPYLNMPKEENPFLGYRAIRYCLDHVDLFKTQLRAIYRASVYGNPKIMIPMISDLGEILKVKAIIEEVKEELRFKSIAFNEVPLGIMIETPSAAMMADVLAQHVSFFSIGTNDLTQYTLAADRLNPDVKSIYSYFSPSVLRLIDRVIQAGESAGIHVGMCGEAAGNEKLIPVLLAMGLKEFSMSPSKILKVRAYMRKVSVTDSLTLKNQVLQAGSLEDVMRILNAQEL